MTQSQTYRARRRTAHRVQFSQAKVQLHTSAVELNQARINKGFWLTSRTSSSRRFRDLSVSNPLHRRAVCRREFLIPQDHRQGRLQTRQGHDLDVAASALQKAIRRSHVDDASYWSMEMFDRYPHYVWRRLKVILSEDVGIAEPTMPATIHSLHETFTEQRSERKKRGGTGGGRLPTLHAVILLASAKKSRLVNHALIHHTAGDRHELYRDPPDWALDRHTLAGRKLGRGMDHFFEDAALLADPETGALSPDGNVHDPYAVRARRALEDNQ